MIGSGDKGGAEPISPWGSKMPIFGDNSQNKDGAAEHREDRREPCYSREPERRGGWVQKKRLSCTRWKGDKEEQRGFVMGSQSNAQNPFKGVEKRNHALEAPLMGGGESSKNRQKKDFWNCQKPRGASLFSTNFPDAKGGSLSPKKGQHRKKLQNAPDPLMGDRVS